MRRFFAALVAGALAVTGAAVLSSSTAAQAAPTLPALAVSGNKIVIAGTTTVPELRGGNILRYEWDDGMWTERLLYPRVSQDWKANYGVVGFSSDNVNARSSHYLGMLDEHVALAEANGMYIMLTWRSHTQNGPQPTMPDQRAQDALAFLAARYNCNPHVHFGLQVEPHDASPSDPTTWSELLPRYNTMVDAIAQATTCDPLIFAPGTNWGRDVSGAVNNPVTGTSAAGYSSSNPYPNVAYKTDAYMDSSQFQSNFGVTYDAGMPVFVAEFGDAPEIGMDMADVEALISFVNARPGMGYAAWMWDTGGNPALVTSNTTFNPTSPYGTTVKNDMIQTPPIGSGPDPDPTPPPPPPPPVVTSMDEHEGVFSGTWNAACCWSVKYQDDDRYTAAQNATHTLTFTGTQVAIYAPKAPHHGRYAVRIDGGTETVIDQYASARGEQVLQWTSPTLAAGEHTLRVRVLRTKRSASTGYTVAVDRFDVTS